MITKIITIIKEGCIQKLKDLLTSKNINAWDFIEERKSVTGLGKDIRVITENNNFLVIEHELREEINIYKKDKKITFNDMKTHDPFAVNTIFINDVNHLMIDNGLTSVYGKNTFPLKIANPIELEKLPEKMQDKIIKAKL